MQDDIVFLVECVRVFVVLCYNNNRRDNYYFSLVL